MLKVGVIGLGLIGGSLAKALKLKVGAEVVAFNRSESSLVEAFNENIISEYSTSDLKIFSDCDYIFICTPVDRITGYVDKLLPYIKTDCVITDGGSTKGSICREMQKYQGLYFIGGHPMAGSEKTGYSAAKEYLFENAYYVLSPSDNVPKNKVDEFAYILKEIGAIPVVIDADYHDHTVAAISHIPHIVASSLVNMVKKLDGKEGYMHSLAAGGFKDITRIASGSPEMWNGICKENKKEIISVIKSFKGVIEQFEKCLVDDDEKEIYSFLESARDYRNSFLDRNKSVIPKTYDIFLNVHDKPGIIATISTHLSVNNINIKNIGVINNREFENGILQISLENEIEKEKSVKLLKELNFEIVTR